MKTILYTSRACPFCIMVKRFLENNKVRFEEVNISNNEEKKKEMVEKSGQENVPVVDVDGTIIIGYNLKKLKEALNLQ